MVVYRITAGLVKLNVKHGKTTYPVKGLGSGGLIKPKTLIERRTEHFGFHDSVTAAAIRQTFNSCKSEYLLSKEPSIIYATLQFLYYHQKASATVSNTARLADQSAAFHLTLHAAPSLQPTKRP